MSDVTDIGHDPHAFEAFYREHLGAVERFVARRVGDVHGADQASRLLGSGDFNLCDKEVDYATLRALPTEANALRAALEDAVLHSEDGAVPADWQEILVTDCTIGLLTIPVSSAVRGAAYRSLAALPDTENLGRTTDREGRVGIALAFRDGPYSQHVVVDPDSGDLPQYDFAGPKGEHHTTMLDAGWTDNGPR
jgi:hypothetical protein